MSAHAPISLACCAAIFALTAPARADITVFAAASLNEALTAIAADWTAKTGQTVTLAFAASSAMARQIQAGAPADIFIAAHPIWMEALVESGDVQPDTQRDVAGNRIVLIAHGPDAPPVEINAELDLAGLLGDGRLSMAMVEAVPAGIYGKAALTTLGLWDAVAGQIAQSDNIRTALAFVAQGEAPLGIVYASDARAEPNVTVIGTFPEDSHPPIIYPAALTTDARAPEAAAFLDHLSADAARAIWAEYGFGLPE